MRDHILEKNISSFSLLLILLSLCNFLYKGFRPSHLPGLRRSESSKGRLNNFNKDKQNIPFIGHMSVLSRPSSMAPFRRCLSLFLAFLMGLFLLSAVASIALVISSSWITNAGSSLFSSLYSRVSGLSTRTNPVSVPC